MKKYIQLCAASLLLLITSALFATNYYVDAARPNDNGNGLTLATAKKTLQAAHNIAALAAGDVVYVRAGTYSVSFAGAPLYITKSGNATSGYITFKNYANETPLIEFNSWNGIDIDAGASYLEINGFEIKGYKGATDTRTVAGAEAQYTTYSTCAGLTTNGLYNGNGIIVKDDDNNTAADNSHHIRILNCKVHDCGGGGIAVLGSDYITIENNEVYRNGWYAVYANSGISVYQPYNSDAVTDYKIFIRNNKSYLNDSKVKWFNGCKYSDGNGIIMDDFRNGQNTSAYGIYTAKALVANNIVFGNGGSGIHAYASNNVDIVHNVSYQDGQRSGYNDGGIYGNVTTNVKILNNILVGISGKRINSNNSNTSHTVNYNVFYGGINPPTVYSTNDLRNTDPLFTNPSIDPALADFHINNTSPAVNSGLSFPDVTTDFEGSTRSPTGVDRGAYEVAGIVPVELIDFKATPSVTGNVLTWATATEINTTHFDIERSNNGKSFEKQNSVKANGSHSTYQFIDEKPFNNSTYYRLKINDLDGKITFSNIVNVSKVGKAKVKIYPSVSNGNLTVEGAKSFEIINTFGQIVLPETAAIHHSLFTIHHLKNGVYFVRGLDTEGGLFVEKIIKQ